ncbi:hypothetical protein K523DRAFT_353440 [Schizophyllum commune Tattone D]|nr:hypothetical protein K523DRAFT_353440 [Schizophyllum commune Tattone D]
MTTRLVEALACGEMGCDSATPSTEVLAELLKTPVDKPVSNKPRPAYSYLTVGPTPKRLRALLSVDPLVAADWDGKLASTDIDYLTKNGEELEKAIERDPVTKEPAARRARAVPGWGADEQGTD